MLDKIIEKQRVEGAQSKDRIISNSSLTEQEIWILVCKTRNDKQSF